MSCIEIQIKKYKMAVYVARSSVLLNLHTVSDCLYVCMYMYIYIYTHHLHSGELPASSDSPESGRPECVVLLRDFRLQPRFSWGLRSSAMLRSVGWSLVTDVSGQNMHPIFKGQRVHSSWFDWPLKMGQIFCPETSITLSISI